MHNPFLLELQSKALDPNISMTEIIRSAYVISRKLKLTEFEDWLKKELNPTFY